MDILFLIIGLILGSIVTWFFCKAKFQGNNGLTKTETDEMLKQISELNTKKNVADEKIAFITESLNTTKTQLDEERKNNTELSKLLSAKEADFKNLSEKLNEQKEEVNKLQEKFSIEFKNLANEILEEKTKKFTEQNKINLNEILTPLSTKIKDFEKKVEETYDKESKERFVLKEEVKNLYEMNNKLSQEANNLTNALKGQSKTQGNWGEIILENILEKSGLVKDREYFVQPSYTNNEGKRYQPDVVVVYPGERSVIIDSKVSLTAYERYCSTDNKVEQELALKEHIQSIKTHINELSVKNYSDIAQIKTLDFVMMFMPIEPAYLIAIQKDTELWSFAYDKRILLISPTNLFAVLKMTVSLWRQENQNKNAIEIARQSGALYDKFVSFIEDLVEVGKKIKSSNESYENAMKKLHTGSGNLVKRTLDIQKLGAKTSKELPQSLIDRTDKE